MDSGFGRYRASPTEYGTHRSRGKPETHRPRGGGSNRENPGAASPQPTLEPPGNRSMCGGQRAVDRLAWIGCTFPSLSGAAGIVEWVNPRDGGFDHLDGPDGSRSPCEPRAPARNPAVSQSAPPPRRSSGLAAPVERRISDQPRGPAGSTLTPPSPPVRRAPPGRKGSGHPQTIQFVRSIRSARPQSRYPPFPFAGDRPPYRLSGFPVATPVRPCYHVGNPCSP